MNRITVETVYNNGERVIDGMSRKNMCFFICIEQYLESIGINNIKVRDLILLSGFKGINQDINLEKKEHLLCVDRLVDELKKRLGFPIKIVCYYYQENTDIKDPGKKILNPLVNESWKCGVAFGDAKTNHIIDIYCNGGHYELIREMDGIPLFIPGRKEPIDVKARPVGSSDVLLYRRDIIDMMDEFQHVEGACAIPEAERHICGKKGDNEDTCRILRCCWDPSSNSSIPSCYHRIGHKPSVSVSTMDQGIKLPGSNILTVEKPKVRQFREMTPQLIAREKLLAKSEAAKISSSVSKPGSLNRANLVEPIKQPISRSRVDYLLEEVSKLEKEKQNNIDTAKELFPNEKERKTYLASMILPLEDRIRRYTDELNKLIQDKYLKYKNKYIVLRNRYELV